MGPTEQVKLMMKPVRRVAAIIYLAMIIVVLAVAIAVRILGQVIALPSMLPSHTGVCCRNEQQAPNLGGLVLFLVFIQFVAAVWYAAHAALRFVSFRGVFQQPDRNTEPSLLCVP